MMFKCTEEEICRFDNLTIGQTGSMNDDLKRTIFIPTEASTEEQIKTITDFIKDKCHGMFYIEYVNDGRSVDSMQVIDKRRFFDEKIDKFDIYGDDRCVKDITIEQIVKEHLSQPLSADYRDYNFVAYKAYLKVKEARSLFKPVDPDERGYTNKFECRECNRLITWPYQTKDIDEYKYCPYCGKENKQPDCIIDETKLFALKYGHRQCEKCNNMRYEGYFCGFNAPICTAYKANDPMHNLVWADHPMNKSDSKDCEKFIAKNFWESMTTDAQERLKACCSKQSDIFEIARCFIINKHQEPEKALASALDHLDCNSQFFDLPKEIYNSILDRLTEFKRIWRP